MKENRMMKIQKWIMEPAEDYTIGTWATRIKRAKDHGAPEDLIHALEINMINSLHHTVKITLEAGGPLEIQERMNLVSYQLIMAGQNDLAAQYAAEVIKNNIWR